MSIEDLTWRAAKEGSVFSREAGESTSQRQWLSRKCSGATKANVLLRLVEAVGRSGRGSPWPCADMHDTQRNAEKRSTAQRPGDSKAGRSTRLERSHGAASTLARLARQEEQQCVHTETVKRF